MLSRAIHTVCASLVLAIVLCAAYLCSAAPAPKPRPVARPWIASAETLDGAWSLMWAGIPAPCTFGPNGTWWCLWSNDPATTPPQHWCGSYAVRKGVLTVTEGIAVGRDGTPGNPITWSVALTRPAARKATCPCGPACDCPPPCQCVTGTATTDDGRTIVVTLTRKKP